MNSFRKWQCQCIAKEISPMNAKRVGHETPCVKTGKCMNCETEQRICNYLTVIHPE